MIQKDRLLQIWDLYAEIQTTTSSNYKILLITKLESILAICQPVDAQLWDKLNKFISCCKYIE